jgi:predicted alpha-1,6-mannanase (GH76 family)
MANTPDVRVRLSAEGVQEVIAAMKRIQDEAKKTDGVKALQKGFADLKNELIGGLGVAAAVAGIVELGKKTLENAVNIAHMSEKVGASAEMLSVLTVAAEDASVSQEDLFTGITKLAKAQD